MNMLVYFTFVGVFVVVAHGDANCNSNRRGNAWCARRINEMKSLTGFNAALPAAPYVGNKCTTNAGDNGLFRDLLCCKACKDYLGGAVQAVKDHSYMYTAVKTVCDDNTAWEKHCKRFTAGSSECLSTIGRHFCKRTCGYCSSSTLVAQHSTLAPCVPSATCNNQTMCGLTGAIGGGECTTQGDAVGATSFYGGGKCDCADCAQHNGRACKSDAECGGNLHSCMALKGKCSCLSCKLESPCKTDIECGGVRGTCGYISTDAATLGDMYECYAGGEGKGLHNEMCTCKWCPSSIPCKNANQPCSAATAVAMCGHARFCVGADPTKMRCSCMAPIHIGVDVSATALGVKWVMLKDDSPADVDALAAAQLAPICISGLKCGSAEKWWCGAGNNNACMAADGVSQCASPIAATSNICRCNCAASGVAPSPNLCLGSTFAGGCTMGANDQCGMVVGPPQLPGNLKVDVCTPDMNKGVCSCGINSYPVYSSTVGDSCTTSSDCQPNGDTSAVCADSSATKVCPPATNSCKCVTAVATILNPTPAGYFCLNDADCGWGTCMTTDLTKKCPIDATAADECTCASAGCVGGASCSLTYSTETCGGLVSGCVGKCNCA